MSFSAIPGPGMSSFGNKPVFLCRLDSRISILDISTSTTTDADDDDDDDNENNNNNNNNNPACRPDPRLPRREIPESHV